MDLGTYQMRVVRHGVFEPEGKSPYVLVEFDCEGQECQVYVYISEAAVDMAYKKLKCCGFDIKTQNVYQLQENRTLLAGNSCSVKVYEDEYPKGSGRIKVKFDIVMEDKPISKEGSGRLDAMLRAVADGSDEKKSVKSARAPRRTEPTAIEKEVAEHKADVAAHAEDEEKF